MLRCWRASPFYFGSIPFLLTWWEVVPESSDSAPCSPSPSPSPSYDCLSIRTTARQRSPNLSETCVLDNLTLGFALRSCLSFSMMNSASRHGLSAMARSSSSSSWRGWSAQSAMIERSFVELRSGSRRSSLALLMKRRMLRLCALPARSHSQTSLRPTGVAGWLGVVSTAMRGVAGERCCSCYRGVLGLYI